MRIARPLTIEQIVEAVSSKKPISRRTVYHHITALGIKPVGEIPQRPQLYPPDAAQRILSRYGLA